jgi:hypothetical protein
VREKKIKHLKSCEIKMKTTYDPAFLTWLPDVKACHEKENFENLQYAKNISEDGGLAIEMYQKIQING